MAYPMPSGLVDVFLILFLLVCGMGLYLLMMEFTNLSHFINILIATGCRILSLIFYQFYAPYVQEDPTWLVFEWMIPLVVFAELVFVACGSALHDGESLITNFGSFILIYFQHFVFGPQIPIKQQLY